jgi:hypothetical protein
MAAPEDQATSAPPSIYDALPVPQVVSPALVCTHGQTVRRPQPLHHHLQLGQLGRHTSLTSLLIFVAAMMHLLHRCTLPEVLNLHNTKSGSFGRLHNAYDPGLASSLLREGFMADESIAMNSMPAYKTGVGCMGRLILW